VIFLLILAHAYIYCIFCGDPVGHGAILAICSPFCHDDNLFATGHVTLALLNEAHMRGKLQLKEDRGGYTFTLKAYNGFVVLTGEWHKTNTEARAAIELIRACADNDACYEHKLSANNQPYFVLKDTNGQILGTSQMYSSSMAMKAGIPVVKRNVKWAVFKDLTS
jgi:uncharacterized protein